jgi:hypothetical protein
MKILTFLTLITLAAGCAFGQAELGSHTWTATVKVVDDNDQPVEGANVSVSYFLPASETQNTDKQWDEIKGLSDADGTFTASHTDGSLSLGIHAQKVGYYSTYLDHELYLPGQFDEQTVAANRNPTLKVVLKKIGKPIPMYANRVCPDRPVGIARPVAPGSNPIARALCEFEGRQHSLDISFEACRNRT